MSHMLILLHGASPSLLHLSIQRKPKKVNIKFPGVDDQKIGTAGYIVRYFCLQSSNSRVGFKTNLHFVEVVEMFLCSLKKTGEGMGEVAVSSSIAAYQLGCLRGGSFSFITYR